MPSSNNLRSLVRDVPDFPKAGILFRDITPLLQDAVGLQGTIDAMSEPWQAEQIDFVAGIEARGFILGPAVALQLQAGFLPVRKAGKLPGQVAQQSYELEYGTATIELHQDAISPGDRVLIIDDVLATGGTAQAAVQLVESIGGTIQGLGFLIELTALNGRAPIDGYRIESAIDY